MSSYAPIARALHRLSDEERARLRRKFDIAYFVATEKLSFGGSGRSSPVQDWGVSGRSSPVQGWGVSGHSSPVQDWGVSGRSSPVQGWGGGGGGSGHSSPVQGWGVQGTHPLYKAGGF